MTPEQQRYRRAVAHRELSSALAHLSDGYWYDASVEVKVAAQELVDAHGKELLALVCEDREGKKFEHLRANRLEGFARAIDAYLGKARPVPVGFTHLFTVCVDGQPCMVCMSSGEAHEFVRWSKLGDRAEVWPVEAAGPLVQVLTNVGGDQC